MIYRCLTDLCGWFVTSRIEKAMYQFSRSLHSSAVINFRASLVAQKVKNLPAMRETLLRSLGWEDPLEEGMANHFSILACRIPRTEKPGGLQFTASPSQTQLSTAQKECGDVAKI